MSEPARAGVRELRQNASKLLERVEAGESIEITNHGRVVARLVPVDIAYPRPFAVLVSEGLIHGSGGRPWEVEPIEAPPGTPSNAELLEEQRADR
jgi:prevent-host-death family protein